MKRLNEGSNALFGTGRMWYINRVMQRQSTAGFPPVATLDNLFYQDLEEPGVGVKEFYMIADTIVFV